MLGRVFGALATIVAVITVFTAQADAASVEPADPINGSIGIRLVDPPASAVRDPRAQIYVVDHLAPRTTIERRVEVTNGTAETAHVALYAAAASVDQGSFAVAPDRTPNALTAWTTVAPSQSQVPANGRVIATITIAVPADAAPGELYGVVWAEVRGSDSNDTGLTQVSRVGIRLYVSVGTGAAPAADFVIESLTATRTPSGEPVVIAAVHNTGGLALDLSGSLRLAAGPAGLSAGPFPASLGVTLAPGATERVMITLDPRLPSGPWDAAITLRSGLTERTGDARIEFPDVGSGAAVPVQSSTDDPSSQSRFGLAVIAAVSAACSIVAAMMWSRRRRRPRGSSVVGQTAVASSELGNG